MNDNITNRVTDIHRILDPEPQQDVDMVDSHDILPQEIANSWVDHWRPDFYLE